MSRSASVSVPKRLSFDLEDALPRGVSSPGPREYDSWPCDSFFVLPDAVLTMDAGVFRADLKALDPVLSASLPDWPVCEEVNGLFPLGEEAPVSEGHADVKAKLPREARDRETRPFTLLHNHKGLLVRSSGKGTVLIGGGGDANEGAGSAPLGGGLQGTVNTCILGTSPPSANGPSKAPAQQQQQSQQQHNLHSKASTTIPSKDPSQKDQSSGLCYKDREERVRQMRERQQQERQQKLEELKEQAAAAQRFREQQEAVRRQRLDEMRSKDSERRSQVEERKRLIQQAEQERREAVLRKTAEREQRLELKRRQERSNAVFAFGSSTPRMLDPKENIQSYFGSRRATSTTNVNLSDSSSVIRRSSECQETDLSRKRATSAHSLNRKPDDLRMSTSMYEVFNWDDGDQAQLQPHSSSQGEDPSTRPFVAPPPTAARRRTDLLPTFPSLRDSTSSRGSPRHRSPGRALSLGRLDQLARPRPQRPPSLAPLHESPNRARRMTPARTMSKSMSHLGPQRARTPISQVTDGAGVPVVDGSLDRRSSRSSLALAQPRMTRSEMLRLSKLRRGNHSAAGFRSGTTTPGSPSRPTSALSQTSAGSQVVLRTRSSPKKPRPLSIAGSTLSSADKPRESAAPLASPASPNRESRSIDRKLSNGSVSSKPPRAKSVGSDRSAPSTPAKTPSSKRTLAQVKAESAAKKASERSKTKLRGTPKTTPLQSPSVEAKPLPGADKKSGSKAVSAKEAKANEETLPVEPSEGEKANGDGPEQPATAEKLSDEPSEKEPSAQPETAVAETEAKHLVEEKQEVEQKKEVDETVSTIEKTEDSPKTVIETPSETKSVEPPKPSQAKPEVQDEKTQAQRAAEKPVTGYASEVEYKAALAEKRRQAREAKERELELERQRVLEEEERERREEEEYLKLMEDQKKVEEERLRKAILEAERQREEEALRKEEEEKQRIQAEKIELQKKLEAEEKMKKEEEERQMRKSRVAAIMSRTRGRGGPTSTPSKAESKTPSDETKNLNDSLMSASMTESLINNISSSMSDSMIVEAIESQKTQKSFSEPSDSTIPESSTPPPSTASSQPPSDISSQPLSDLSSQQLLSEVSTDAESSLHSNSQLISQTQTTSGAVITTSTTIESTVVVEEDSEPRNNVPQDVVPGLESSNLGETPVNGNAPTPMDTTPTTQSVDLLGSFNGLNGIGHNGVDSGSFKSSERPDDNQFGSLDPLNTTAQTILTTETKTETSAFDQIIDLNQTKLTNEDAVNSNPPPPIIAFEDNLNKKSQQTQESSSNVPDLLL